jgi:hypothetical protein
LLREGAELAIHNDQAVLDQVMLRYAIKDARLNEAIGLYGEDYEVLSYVHRTNDLRTAEDRRYLDLSLVMECHNGEPWFEANPLLWSRIEDHEKKQQHVGPGEP